MAARPGWRLAGLAGAGWVATVAAVAGTGWLDHLLHQAGRADLSAFAVSSIPVVVAAVSAATVGAVLAVRRPRHPVGWLLLGLGLSQALHDLTYAYTRHGLVARPGSLPGAAYLAGLNNGLVVMWVACAGFVLLLTPTGSLPSPRWRWWARVAAAAAVLWLLGSVIDPAPLRPEYPGIASPLGVPALSGLVDALIAAALVVLVALVVGAVSLLLRFRRARGIERQQLRWLAWGAAVAAMALLTAVTALILQEDFELTTAALGVSAAVLPLSTGAAILRYRLYDLDRIISRTVAYGLLTVLLGGGYAVVVLGLGQLLGRESSLVVAAATLAVAGLFQPARRRIQQAVDRRFNRRRHDAGLTIAAFGARLRDQVDLTTLTGELMAVVDQTMQPTRSSLWLRPRALAAPSARASLAPVDLTRYRALSFDCYGTLIDWEAGIAAVLGPWARTVGLDLDDERLLEAYAGHEAAVEREQPAARYPEVLATAFRRTGEALGRTVDDAWARRLGGSVPDWPAFGDSPGALASLAAHYQLLVVSNVHRDGFAASNRRLRGRFAAVITAEDVGAYKPAPNHFQALLGTVEDLGIAPGELLHVAQSLFHDHVPARRAGLATVWVNRRHDRPGWGATPEPSEGWSYGLEVRSLGELAAAADAAFE